MADLASRSHEWQEWTITEVHRFEWHLSPIEGDSKLDEDVDIFLELLPIGQKARSLHIKKGGSPSKAVSQILTNAMHSKIPAFKNDSDPKLMSDAPKEIEAIRSFLGAGKISNWRGNIKLLKTFKKNSHGEFFIGGQSELVLFQGTKTIFSGSGFDPSKI